MAKYKLFGRPSNSNEWEVIDTANSLSEAQSLLQEYRMAYRGWIILIGTKGPK